MVGKTPMFVAILLLVVAGLILGAVFCAAHGLAGCGTTALVSLFLLSAGFLICALWPRRPLAASFIQQPPARPPRLA